MHIKIVALLTLFVLSGCVSVNPAQVRTKVGPPESAVIDTVSIPKDQSAPEFLLVVHPINVPDATTKIGISGTAADDGVVTISRISDEREQARITTQFQSALKGIGNFRIIESQRLQSDGKGGYRFSGVKPSGAKGPIVVKAIISEYTSDAQSASRRYGVPLIATAEESQSIGFVAMDITAVDAESGEMFASFRSVGQFAEASGENRVGILLPVFSSQSSAKTVMAQATRAALNDAAVRLFEALKGQ